MAKLIVVGSLILAAIVAGLAYWINARFEAPSARQISSLAEYLGASSVLAVFAHPDDEILAAGSLAEAAARRDVEVRTITASRGEAGRVESPICRDEDLGIVRHAELLKHGFLLGLTEQLVWELRDGDLAAHEATMRDRLVREIRRLKPDLLLTFDPAAGYSLHPDHQTVGRATTAAFDLAGDPTHQPDLGDPHHPQTLVYLLVPPGVMRTFGGERGAKVADSQPAAELAMPIDTTLKRRGWYVHASQYGYLRRVWGAPPWVLYAFFDKEHFRVAMRHAAQQDGMRRPAP